MPRRPLADQPLDSAERSRRHRLARGAAGLPSLDVVRRALTAAAVQLPEDTRRALLEAMAATVDEAQRPAYRRVAAQILDLPDTDA